MSNYFEQFLDDSFDDGYHHGRRGSVGDPHGQELICTKKIHSTFSYWELRVSISSPWWPAWSQASTWNKRVTLFVSSILKIWYCKCDHVTPSYLTPALVPKLPTHPEPWLHLVTLFDASPLFQNRLIVDPAEFPRALCTKRRDIFSW